VHNFRSLGGQIAASYAELTSERAVEADGKLVSGFSLDLNLV